MIPLTLVVAAIAVAQGDRLRGRVTIIIMTITIITIITIITSIIFIIITTIIIAVVIDVTPPTLVVAAVAVAQGDRLRGRVTRGRRGAA